MATVSYEILTKVEKTFMGKVKALRAYTFTAQIIVKEMTPHNFAQLKIPVNGTMAVFPILGYLPTTKELSATALKSAVTKRMNAVKARFEKKLQLIPAERKAVTVTATGSYKDRLTPLKELLG